MWYAKVYWRRGCKIFYNKGIKISEILLDPLFPSFRLSSEEEFVKWFKFYVDVGVKSPDELVLKNVEILRNHPLIPKDVKITGYVYEVETHRLRKPNQRIYEETSKFQHGTIVKE